MRSTHTASKGPASRHQVYEITTTTEQAFPLFPQLPLELREEIWRCCLPRRFYEIGSPFPETTFSVKDLDEPFLVPCTLYHTTQTNWSPSLIWSVCRDSRGLALETGLLAHNRTHEPADDAAAHTTSPGKTACGTPLI